MEPRLTAEEFARQYAERSGVTVEWLREQGHDVRPCDCDDDICTGWQMVNVELHDAEWVLRYAGTPVESATVVYEREPLDE